MDLGEPYFTQHDQVAPPAHSRSASVLSPVRGRPEDDISSIMMRGATDLRNAKFEVEESVRLRCVSHAYMSLNPSVATRNRVSPSPGRLCREREGGSFSTTEGR